ncbi:TetR/AcrR family transcriptional regulator [Nonomuraea sp. NPDC026600]|uniref:TetR/AcrR family transcriptional regulator n=1 Tax=Nonomuraea sp. NPDC026600 TaxID=3155363 RepID=UPI003400B785
MTNAARADARHNRARVLEAAQEAFAAEGLSVPLDVIARRAGVGAGTVYRHFPSKEALFEAVVHDRIERLADELTALLTTPGAATGEAFFTAFSSTVEQAGLNKALCESFVATPKAEVAPEARRRYGIALAALLDRACQAGAVRPDAQITDVMALMAGCVAMEAHSATPGRATTLVLDGLRTGRSPLPTVTKPVTKPGYRNETSEEPGPPARCEECGTAIPTSRTGRPPRFCGGACRQKAHRRRATG